MLGSLWLIPIICLAGAVLNLALGVIRAPKSVVTLVGVGSVGAATIAAFTAVWEFLRQPAEVIVEPYFTWISAGAVRGSRSVTRSLCRVGVACFPVGQHPLDLCLYAPARIVAVHATAQ